MKMFNRRTMFAALAAVGIPLTRADLAVAHAFEDDDFLRERQERAAQHNALMSNEEAEHKEFYQRFNAFNKAQHEREQHERSVLKKYTREWQDRHGEGYDVNAEASIDVTKADLTILLDNNHVDFLPNSAGTRMVPVFMGMFINVIA